jgi:hypothetical protein
LHDFIATFLHLVGPWCCRRRDQHEAIERYERESTIYNMEQRGQFPALSESAVGQNAK